MTLSVNRKKTREEEVAELGKVHWSFFSFKVKQVAKSSREKRQDLRISLSNLEKGGGNVDPTKTRLSHKITRKLT